MIPILAFNCSECGCPGSCDQELREPSTGTDRALTVLVLLKCKRCGHKGESSLYPRSQPFDPVVVGSAADGFDAELLGADPVQLYLALVFSS